MFYMLKPGRVLLELLSPVDTPLQHHDKEFHFLTVVTQCKLLSIQGNMLILNEVRCKNRALSTVNLSRKLGNTVRHKKQDKANNTLNMALLSL